MSYKEQCRQHNLKIELKRKLFKELTQKFETKKLQDKISRKTNSSITNIHEWEENYEIPYKDTENGHSRRIKDLFCENTTHDNRWNGYCIICNKTSIITFWCNNEILIGHPEKFCYDCRDQYKKLKHNNWSKARTLLTKTKSESRICPITGCNKQQLKEHLSILMTKEMDFNNYGKVWQIDHVIPISYFNLFDNNELKIACHYTNLAPILKQDNLNKNARINLKK
jgi:hypothetical protein